MDDEDADRRSTEHGEAVACMPNQLPAVDWERLRYGRVNGRRESEREGACPSASHSAPKSGRTEGEAQTRDGVG